MVFFIILIVELFIYCFIYFVINDDVVGEILDGFKIMALLVVMALMIGLRDNIEINIIKQRIVQFDLRKNQLDEIRYDRGGGGNKKKNYI